MLLVAHLDSINKKAVKTTDPAPGADDDASGCAALLEAAQVMGEYKFQKTVRFLITTGEEQGTLGSMVYAERVKVQNPRVQRAGSAESATILPSLIPPGHRVDRQLQSTRNHTDCTLGSQPKGEYVGTGGKAAGPSSSVAHFALLKNRYTTEWCFEKPRARPTRTAWLMVCRSRANNQLMAIVTKLLYVGVVNAAANIAKVS